MEFGLTAEEIAEIKEVIASFPQVEEVTIFGSRAMGNYKPSSDIDLVIAGSDADFQVLLALSAALDDLEMLYRFDIQLLSSIKDQSVLDHIARNGKHFC